MPYVERVYLLLLTVCLYILVTHSEDDPVDGRWSSWSDWQGCSVDCGQGVLEKVRTCDNPPPQNGGDECVGVSIRPGPVCNIPCGCDLNPCAYNGSCIQNATDPKDYNCTCIDGFFGQNCTECGADIVLSTDTSLLRNLSSAGYPQSYPDNLHCTWTVSADPDYTLQIVLHEFDVERSAGNDCVNDYTLNVRNYTTEHLFSDEDITRYCPCIYDLLIIYNGQDLNPSDELYVLCNGKQPTDTVVIDNNQMSLTFHTDPGFTEENKLGFHLTITAVPDVTSSCPDCKDGARCEETETGYQCMCPDGQSGASCQADSSCNSVSSCLMVLVAGWLATRVL